MAYLLRLQLLGCAQQLCGMQSGHFLLLLLLLELCTSLLQAMYVGAVGCCGSALKYQ